MRRHLHGPVQLSAAEDLDQTLVVDDAAGLQALRRDLVDARARRARRG